MILQIPHNRVRSILLLFGVTTSMLMVAVGKDILHAYIKGYHFYLSESILFETYWLLFIPLLACTIPILSKVKGVRSMVLLLLLSLLHLAVFSALVFVVSALLFDHIFAFTRVFTDAFSDSGISTLLIYGFAGIIFQRRSSPDKTPHNKTESVITVTHGNRAVLLSIDSILYIRSETPYIALVTKERTYLYNSSLKAFLKDRAPLHFIRIHRSTIVNTSFVESFRSRQNGDYDLTLSNGHTLRLSRNYSKQFKSAFK